jgi:hypothetical protein
MRSVSTYLLALSANNVNTKPFVHNYTPRIIKRADEINEALAMHLELFAENGKKRIPNSLKKGIADSFKQFDEYQFSKYNRKGIVTFKDAIMLTHPKEPSAIIKKILDEKLEVPYTWETQLSASTDKKKTWEELISSGKLGIMAMVRNLRNMLDAKISDEHIDRVISVIKSENVIKKSRMFPFRFYQAFKQLEEVSHPRTSDILDALEVATEIAFDAVPKMNGTTYVVCDTSGSMDTSLSRNSTMTLKEVGLLLGCASHKFTDKSLFACFAERFGIHNIMKTSSIIDNVTKVEDWSSRLGGSTNGFLSIQYLNENNINVDRILIFTDCQLYDSTGWGFYRRDSENTIRKEFNKYRSNVNPKCILYLFDLSEYGTVNFPENDRSVVNVAGWSEKIFNFIQLHEIDPDKQIKYIKEKY